MARYLFHIEDGEPVRDPVPVELPNDDAARRHAEVTAMELQRNRSRGDRWRVVVTNEDGIEIAEVPVLWRTKE